MSDRATRARIAQQTLEILREGGYTAPSGRGVVVGEALEAAKAGTRLFTPEDLDAIRPDVERKLAERAGAAPVAIEVGNETTLEAASRLSGDDAADVLALNFASAKKPGGGFLSGAQAQEESLARVSGLYACLTMQPAYYERNRACGSCLYTDHVIYSPCVPVLRDDADRLLERPFRVSFLTAPAVNAGAVREREPQNVPRIEPVMLRRIEAVLSIALLRGHTTLVLGAWGCGVFRNDPADVADWFGRYLCDDGRFATAFDAIVFAVLDPSSGRKVIGPFERLVR